MTTRMKSINDAQLEATPAHRIDLDAMTIIHTDAAGEDHDLNAGSWAPCATIADLADFVRELHEQGAYDAATRDDLLGELAQV